RGRGADFARPGGAARARDRRRRDVAHRRLQRRRPERRRRRHRQRRGADPVRGRVCVAQVLRSGNGARHCQSRRRLRRRSDPGGGTGAPVRLPPPRHRRAGRSRNPARYRAFVRSAKLSDARATVGVTATVQAAQPEVVAAAVSGLLDAELSKVRPLLARATSALTPAEQQSIQDVAERLGVRNLTPAALSKAIDTLEASVADKIAGAVKAKIDSGFAFEYGRIEENATLLQATLTDEALAAMHAPL